MSKLAAVTSGDIGRTRTVQLGDESAAGVFAATDFTGVVSSVVAHVQVSGAAAVTLAAAFTDESTGVLEVDLGDGAGWLATLTVPATSKRNATIEYEVTYTDGSVQTWGPDILEVNGQLA